LQIFSVVTYFLYPAFRKEYPEDNPSGFFMQEIVSTSEAVKGFQIDELPLEDKQRLVGAFVWLIEEDKKQNPASYQPKKT
jgi:hypothetical protein